MASTKELATTLPRKAPNTEHHRATLNHQRGYRFAIYSIAHLDGEGLHQLERDINTAELSTDNSRLALQTDMDGGTLRDAYNHHIRARDDFSWMHPLYFIVADQSNPAKNGLLVIHLNCSMDEEDLIGVGRCGIDMADTWGANIDIGNQDWLDLKEEEQELWGGENPYDDQS